MARKTAKKKTAKKTPARSRKKPPTPPKVVAAIDVGATSIRMEIGELRPRGEFTLLDELVHPASLGDDTFRVGVITPETMRAVCKVMKNFATILAQFQVEAIRAVATSAIRDATNRDVVVDRIRHESGIQLEVLDAVEEARLTYQTLLPFLQKHLKSRRKTTLVVDLGGGSTEMMVLKGLELMSGGTRRLGTQRLFHMIRSAEHGASKTLLESVVHNIVSNTEGLYRNHKIHECVIINPLLREALQDLPGTVHLEQGISLPVEVIQSALAEAEGLSPEKRAETFGITGAESELLLAALLILNEFIDTIGVKRIFLVDAELLLGLRGDLSLSLEGKSVLADFSQQILGSAAGIAERYAYDKRHARQVEKLACTLFEALSGFFDLADRDCLYLRAAAILHDIGMYVSELAHHKHSAYLIRWSEIVGLSEEERHFIALLARYHRKAHPQQSHGEFRSLPLHDRMRVTKLAAILRIADALDRRHGQTIKSLEVQLGAAELRLLVDGPGDLAVETLALTEKGRLFQETTGLRIKLRRKYRS